MDRYFSGILNKKKNRKKQLITQAHHLFKTKSSRQELIMQLVYCQYWVVEKYDAHMGTRLLYIFLRFLTNIIIFCQRFWSRWRKLLILIITFLITDSNLTYPLDHKNDQMFLESWCEGWSLWERFSLCEHRLAKVLLYSEDCPTTLTGTGNNMGKVR